MTTYAYKKIKNVTKDIRGYIFADLVITETKMIILKRERVAKIFKAPKQSEWRLCDSGEEINRYGMRDVVEAYKANDGNVPLED